MTEKEILEYVIACVDRCADDEVYSKDVFNSIYSYLDKLYKTHED